MSWVSSPRAGYGAGDPGLFSFLGKAIGAVANVATGGIAGTVYNTAKQLLTKRPSPAGPMPTLWATGSLARAQSAQLVAPSPRPALMPAPIALPGGAIVRADSVKVSGSTIGPGGSIFSTGQATLYGPQIGAPGAATGAMVCGDGRVRHTHANKSGYFLKGGTYVAPGTRCVANRRRNPLNPRALSRAMSRVAGAQKAVRSLIRFERVSKKGKLIVRRPAKK
jgi:hypothetical protein